MGRESLDRTGEKVIHPVYGEAIITRYINNKDMYIKFTKTDGISKCRYGDFIRLSIKDYMYKSVFETGYLGNECKELKNDYPTLYKKVYELWSAMMQKCYNVAYHRYEYYGGAGITVHLEWHNFSKFFCDFIKLPGYDEADFIAGRLILDKYKLQHNITKPEMIYYKDTCCLLSTLEHIDNLPRLVDFIAIHPDGSETNEHNMAKFANKHNIGAQCVLRCVSGERKSAKGYKFKPISKV